MVIKEEELEESVSTTVSNSPVKDLAITLFESEENSRQPNDSVSFYREEFLKHTNSWLYHMARNRTIHEALPIQVNVDNQEFNCTMGQRQISGSDAQVNNKSVHMNGLTSTPHVPMTSENILRGESQAAVFDNLVAGQNVRENQRDSNKIEARSSAVNSEIAENSHLFQFANAIFGTGKYYETPISYFSRILQPVSDGRFFSLNQILEPSDRDNSIILPYHTSQAAPLVAFNPVVRANETVIQKSSDYLGQITASNSEVVCNGTLSSREIQDLHDEGNSASKSLAPAPSFDDNKYINKVDGQPRKRFKASKDVQAKIEFDFEAMNQTCKVCGEPAAGFHFGAFTCEGCKSFFGRSYNNLNSISDCKNNGECVINKKNRTACKACRLRKCLLVGMSKSGSRYGRRSNWFKIHCLLQEQQQQQQQQQQQAHSMLSAGGKPPQRTPPPPHHQPVGINLLLPNQQFAPNPLMHLPRTKEELMLLGIDDYKHAGSPSVSSPESHNSDSSVEDPTRRLPLFPGIIPPTLFHPPSLLFPGHYPPLYPGLLQPVNNNNNRMVRNHNPGVEVFKKMQMLDAVLQSQRTPTPPESTAEVQEDPIDLSMKTSERGSSPAGSIRSGSDSTERGAGSEADEESDCESDRELKRLKVLRPTPLDLTTKV